MLSTLILVLAFQSPDDAALRDLVQRYAAIREQQDAAALEKLFTADVDQLVSSGDWRRGREVLVKGTLASSRNNTGTRTLMVETIRYLTRDVAIADARYEIGERKMWSTFVFTRTPEGWRIAAIRNMLPAAPAR